MAAYPNANPDTDFVLRDDGYGAYVAAWHIAGPVPAGVILMSAGAFQLFAALYTKIRPGAQDLLRFCAEIEVIRSANPEIAQEVADAAADPDTLVGGTMMSKSQVATALLLLDMIKTLRGQSVGATGLTVEQALWRG